MTVTQLAQLAERALAATAGEAQVTVTHERSQLLRFAGSRPTQATEVDELEVEVTAVRGGHVAAARTNRTEPEALAEVARRAERAVEATARGGPGAYPGLPPPGPGARPHDGWDEATAGLAAGTGGAALEQVLAAVEDDGLRAAGAWSAGAVRTAVAASTGLRAADALTDAFLKVLCQAPGGRSGYAARTAAAAADLDPDAVARRASQTARRGGGSEPERLTDGEYPAVLEAEAVGTLLEHLGAMAFDGLAHAEGRGALAGRLGTRVAAPAINLSDSPRYPATLPRTIDAEGVAKGPLPLIQDGVAHAVTHDTRSAAVAGEPARSTGHALAAGGAAQGAAPSNLVLVGGGARDRDELVAGVERGIYVTRLWYVNPVAAQRTLLTGMSRDGTFLIEDGRITRPLCDVRFTDSVLRLLEATEALAARPRLVSEGEFYGRRRAGGVVCPALRVSGLRVTGSTPR